MLSNLTSDYQNRILRYSENGTKFLYREIDFIAEPSPDQFVFCEIKLKQRYKSSLLSKEAGWSQLNKSLAIAKDRYKDIGGLSICVDMSWVYGLDSPSKDINYLPFNDLQEPLSSPSTAKKVVWLSSRELSRLAIQQGLLKPTDVSRMKVLFEEFTDPLSILGDTDYAPNHAFGSLIDLKKSNVGSSGVSSNLQR